MTEITDLNDTDALNTAVTGNSTEGNTANMGGMDNLFQATLGMLSRFRNANIFRLRDNTDTTKLLAFNLAGLTTATTRTVTLQDASGTMALTSDVQGFGQCRLAVDGSNLKLSPYQGNLLTINGSGKVVPSAGITLAPSALTPGTLYYIYAYMNSGTMTLEALEASIAPHATDATTGVEIKSGDATRTLVGMARPVTGPAFDDRPTARLVRSWFNRGLVGLYGGRAPLVLTTTSTTFVELSTGLRVEFLTWAGETVQMGSTGWSYNGGAEETNTTVALDGDATNDTTRTRTSTTFNSAGGPAVTIGSVVPAAEGYHYFTMMGAVSGNTGVWQPTSGSRDGVACVGMIG